MSACCTHTACNSCNKAFSNAFVDTGERSWSFLYSAVRGAVSFAVINLFYRMHSIINSMFFRTVL